MGGKGLIWLGCVGFGKGLLRGLGRINTASNPSGTIRQFAVYVPQGEPPCQYPENPA